MVLFFHLELKRKSYGHFKILKLSFFEIKILKWENGHNSVISTRNEKITPLSFIQLLKLKERKWSYFFISSKNKQVMPTFIFGTKTLKLFIFMKNWNSRATLKCRLWAIKFGTVSYYGIHNGKMVRANWNFNFWFFWTPLIYVSYIIWLMHNLYMGWISF